MNGKDIIIILSQNSTALASTAVKSHDISTVVDTIEKASSTQQDWREYVKGRKGWSVNMSYLVTTASKILWELEVGKTFDITIRDAGNSPTYSLVGKAILETAKQTYTVGNLANGSFVLKGTGPLSEPQPTT